MPGSTDSSWVMNLPTFGATPKANAYDVVIMGGATMVANTAWFLASHPDFRGTVLIVEPDSIFAKAQTGASNNCMRQHFANQSILRIGQFAAAGAGHPRQVIISLASFAGALA